ncbi:SufD family Fe-S cluster assembly protein [Desulfurococcus amylolyticus]|uniref:ABC transporter, membrane component n=1 Tax=Desulfurococcus amylolyticus DSM 16532 TaxID=768672 RepID=I3XPZ3_DESAM|nr:SufD family Fe-S cluster assembly protein [Desulfurococcus amylolyticus]AFL66017.1 ABC transporter, membrane component [Desulfurococcus amylolyticus DSM 16532]
MAKTVSRGVGDSPTIKKYIDKSPLEELVRRALNREAPITNILIKALSPNAFIDPLPPSGSIGFKSIPVITVSQGFYRVRSTGGVFDISVEGSGDGVIAVGYIELILEGPGLTILRIPENPAHRIMGIKVTVAKGVDHEVLLIHKSGRRAMDLSEIIVEQGDASRLALVALFNTGSILQARVESIQGAGSSIEKTILVNSTQGSRVEVEDYSYIDNPSVSVESYIRSRLEGGSIAVLRGRGIVSRRASGSRIVYGIESLINDAESTAYMHPFLDIHSNNIVEARHYARNYLLTMDKLFYIETRGLKPEEAAMLLVHGFLTRGLSRAAREIILSNISSS